MATEREYVTYNEFAEGLESVNPSANDKAVLNVGGTGPKSSVFSAIAAFVHNTFAAFVNALTAKTSFANGDKIPVVNGSTATAMEASKLLELTAQNALAGNVAPAFDPTKPNDAGGYAYYAGEVVANAGKNYRFKVNHSSGAWNASQVTAINESDFFGTQKTTEVFNFVSTGSEIVQFVSTIPGELVKLEIDASNWTNNNYPVSGRIFFIDGDSLQLPQIYLGTTIPNEYIFRASSTTTYLHVRGDSGSRMQVKAIHYGILDSHKFDGCSQGADLFEMGNISVNPNAVYYSSSTSRLRSKQGIYLTAKAGDYIEVTNTNYYIGIGYKYAGESNWTWSNWLKRFRFSKDGEFVLLARLVNEATETFDNLVQSFLVYTQHGSCSYNARFVYEQEKMQAVDSSILTKVKSVSFTANSAAQTINLGKIDDECWLHYDTQEDVDVSGVTDYYAFFVIRLSNGVDGYGDVVRADKSTGATTYSRIKGSVYVPKGYGNLQLYMRASSLTKPYLIWIDNIPPVKVHYPSFGSVKSVAHRGGQGRPAARENTTAAMRLAAIYGYKYVETDLHTTSDGYVVCFHDDAIPNLGNIADLTLAQVKTYQPSGYLLDPTIPTLEDLLQVCKEYNLHPYLEIKGGGNTTAYAAIAIVADYGMLDSVTWLCFTASYLQTIRTAYAKSRLGLLGGSIDASLIASALALKNDSNEVFVDVSDASNYALAKAENIPVEVWTVSDLPAQHYVSGLTTNNAFPITGKYKGF